MEMAYLCHIIDQYHVPFVTKYFLSNIIKYYKHFSSQQITHIWH